jgi:hypothetical protein
LFFHSPITHTLTHTHTKKPSLKKNHIMADTIQAKIAELEAEMLRTRTFHTYRRDTKTLEQKLLCL